MVIDLPDELVAGLLSLLEAGHVEKEARCL